MDTYTAVSMPWLGEDIDTLMVAQGRTWECEMAARIESEHQSIRGFSERRRSLHQLTEFQETVLESLTELEASDFGLAGSCDDAPLCEFSPKRGFFSKGGSNLRIEAPMDLCAGPSWELSDLLPGHFGAGVERSTSDEFQRCMCPVKSPVRESFCTEENGRKPGPRLSSCPFSKGVRQKFTTQPTRENRRKTPLRAGHSHPAYQDALAAERQALKPYLDARPSLFLESQVEALVSLRCADCGHINLPSWI
ncbi:hypothetical protein FVE85_0832 [Porphyridium purpureum]|uniref:Uncharacterized protein n=1 Tax=Porphyridium purpureum TaxID=35688 RepID=A0A5J4Z2G1_PORPP|nr:hypothetical protein FVE85_0832 [Porphyridium purpureum]|eukprot:POR0512..scf208_2